MGMTTDPTGAAPPRAITIAGVELGPDKSLGHMAYELGFALLAQSTAERAALDAQTIARLVERNAALEESAMALWAAWAWLRDSQFMRGTPIYRQVEAAVWRLAEPDRLNEDDARGQ